MNIIVILIIIAFGSVVVIALLKLSQYADTVPKKAQEETVEKKFIPNIPTAVTNTENKSEVKSKEDIPIAMRQSLFREMVENAFEDNITFVIVEFGAEEVIADVLVFNTIADTYKALMDDKEQLMAYIGLTDKEFDLILEEECKKMIAKYVKSNEVKNYLYDRKE